MTDDTLPGSYEDLNLTPEQIEELNKINEEEIEEQYSQEYVSEDYYIYEDDYSEEANP